MRSRSAGEQPVRDAALRVAFDRTYGSPANRSPSRSATTPRRGGASPRTSPSRDDRVLHSASLQTLTAGQLLAIVANLTINIAGRRLSIRTDFWAVSQAAPCGGPTQGRNLSLMTMLASGNTASRVHRRLDFSGNRHQRIPAAILVRNSTLTVDQRVWNQSSPACKGPAVVPDRPYTTLGTSPLTRERPLLYRDSHGGYRCRAGGPTQLERPGANSYRRSIPLISSSSHTVRSATRITQRCART